MTKSESHNRPRREPLTKWYCDVCGDTVDVEKGYVIWRRTDGVRWDFKIIHKVICDDKSYGSSLPLSDFLGPDGLIRLTSFLSYGEYHLRSLESDQSRGAMVRNMDEFVVLLRRLQIPFYEEARRRFGDVEFQQDVDGANEVRVYGQDILEEAANWREEEE